MAHIEFNPTNSINNIAPIQSSNQSHVPLLREGDSIDCSACCTSVLDTAWNYLSYAYDWFVELFAHEPTPREITADLLVSDLTELKNWCLPETEKACAVLPFKTTLSSASFWGFKSEVKDYFRMHGWTFNEEEFTPFREKIQNFCQNLDPNQPVELSITAYAYPLRSDKSSFSAEIRGTRTNTFSTNFIRDDIGNWSGMEMRDSYSLRMINEIPENDVRRLGQVFSLVAKELFILATDIEDLELDSEEKYARVAQVLPKTLRYTGDASADDATRSFIEYLRQSGASKISIDRSFKSNFRTTIILQFPSQVPETISCQGWTVLRSSDHVTFLRDPIRN